MFNLCLTSFQAFCLVQVFLVELTFLLCHCQHVLFGDLSTVTGWEKEVRYEIGVKVNLWMIWTCLNWFFSWEELGVNGKKGIQMYVLFLFLPFNLCCIVCNLLCASVCLFVFPLFWYLLCFYFTIVRHYCSGMLNAFLCSFEILDSIREGGTSG